jgi:hypothetical protein
LLGGIRRSGQDKHSERAHRESRRFHKTSVFQTALGGEDCAT